MCEEKHVDLLLIGKEGKINYRLFNNFNIFTYNHNLHRRKNIFVVIVKVFGTKEILTHHIKDRFSINGK